MSNHTLRPVADGQWTAEQSGCAENPGVFDTGNGALQFRLKSRDYPGVTRVEFRSYSGQDEDADWYEADELPGYSYANPDQCARDNRSARDARLSEEAADREQRQRAYQATIRSEQWSQPQRELDAGFAADAPEMRIGEIVWQWEYGHHVHTVHGAEGISPRWVRLLAARHWPDAGGIQVVRVRAVCDRLGPDNRPIGVRSILLDLSPERMGIDATELGLADAWCR